MAAVTRDQNPALQVAVSREQAEADAGVFGPGQAEKRQHFDSHDIAQRQRADDQRLDQLVSAKTAAAKARPR